MQAFRHGSRRVLHIPVLQKTLTASAKAYSAEAISTGAARKTKEERIELARQFISKFQAANDGQLPGITLLRKEVGGKYDTLKEVLEDVSKVQDKQDTPKPMGEPKDAKEKAQELAAAVKDGTKKKSPAKEDNIKGKKETPEVSKSLKTVKATDPAKPRAISKATESAMPVKDTGLRTEDDDDDSDVAAPEYDSSSIKMVHQKMKEDVTAVKGKDKVLERDVTAVKGKDKVLESGPRAQLKPDLKKQCDGQALKMKLADMKQPVVRGGDIRLESPHRASNTASAVDDTVGKHFSTDGSRSPTYSPLTTVVRIVNLPQHLTPSKLKAICESVAGVHEIDFRGLHIADVHFDVELEKMPELFSRLRRLPLGTSIMRVFPAQRFFCGKNANGQFTPQDAQQYRSVRNVLFSSIDQRLKFLNWQLQDFRELQGVKQQVR